MHVGPARHRSEGWCRLRLQLRPRPVPRWLLAIALLRLRLCVALFVALFVALALLLRPPLGRGLGGVRVRQDVSEREGADAFHVQQL